MGTRDRGGLPVPSGVLDGFEQRLLAGGAAGAAVAGHAGAGDAESGAAACDLAPEFFERDGFTAGGLQRHSRLHVQEHFSEPITPVRSPVHQYTCPYCWIDTRTLSCRMPRRDRQPCNRSTYTVRCHPYHFPIGCV